DDIDLVAFARHEIREDEPVATPPFGAIGDLESAQPLRRKNRPMGDCAHEARRLRIDDEFTHFRIDAIGPDDDIAIDLYAILQSEADRAAQFLERHEPMIEGYSPRRDRSLSHCMHLAPL